MIIEPKKVGAFVKCNLKTASKEEISEIKTALEKFGVLFFRNQDLDSKSYINLAKNFGNLADYPMLKGLEGFPEITVVERKKSDKGANFGGIFYHSDFWGTKVGKGFASYFLRNYKQLFSQRFPR